MEEKLIPAHPQEIVNASQYLEELYPYWLNNYLSPEKFAEDHGLTEEEGGRLLILARDVHLRRREEEQE